MAINFLQAKKRQRYMMLFLALVICAILLVIWFGFFKAAAPLPPYVAPTTFLSKIKIDWEILKDPELETLKAFELVSQFEDEVGRENPFTPY